MMKIIISGTSDKPIYRQIFDQISRQVLNGELPAGQVLPPIRTVARELRISVITIKKAWEELERAGFIYTMVGRGCFVADLSANNLADKRRTVISDKIKKDIAYYKELGLSLEDLLAVIREYYQD